MDIQSVLAISHLFVLDFEATCKDNDKMVPCSEIIQFPVIPINLATGQEEPFIFHRYIKPKFNPVLTPFCTELTGITQAIVDQGIPLQKALQQFNQWLKEHKLADFVFITCGDWDLRTCLRKQAQAKHIELSPCFKRWINIKQAFPKEASLQRVRSMPQMLEVLGLELKGRHHSGIDDCRNIAAVIKHLIKQFKWKPVAKMVHA